jgi:putative crossover junction endodeoxyribonuclease
MDEIVFFAEGVPAPQGSKTHVGGGRLIESSRQVGPWRDAVRRAAVEAMASRPPIDGPVYLVQVFALPRPKSHYGTGRNSGRVKRGAPSRPPVRPDLDKLARAVGDALTGVCYHDDAQVVNLCAAKYYVAPSGRLSAPGVEIRVHGEGGY